MTQQGQHSSSLGAEFPTVDIIGMLLAMKAPVFLFVGGSLFSIEWTIK